MKTNRLRSVGSDENCSRTIADRPANPFRISVALVQTKIFAPAGRFSMALPFPTTKSACVPGQRASSMRSSNGRHDAGIGSQLEVNSAGKRDGRWHRLTDDLDFRGRWLSSRNFPPGSRLLTGRYRKASLPLIKRGSRDSFDSTELSNRLPGLKMTLKKIEPKFYSIRT